MERRSPIDDPVLSHGRRVRIVLVRHGESAWNVEGRFQGQSGSGLSPLGHEQARCLAEILARTVPRSDLTFASDLERVRQTVKPFVELTGAAVTVDERLREIDTGTWSGRSFDEVAQDFPEVLLALRRGEDVRRGGGETFEELRERVAAVIAEICRATPDRVAESGLLTAIVFTHGGPIRMAAAEALGLPSGGHRRLSPPANCSLTELDALVDGDGERREMRLAAYNVPVSNADRDSDAPSVGH